MMLNTQRYDELGRLACKRLYNAVDSIRYTYNIQDWMTRIQSSEFDEKIYYNQSFPLAASSAVPAYNGNISASSWTYSTQTNGYTYSYDDKNRFYFCYGIVDSVFADGYYTERMQYDKSGNITRLERWDNHDAMNILHYTYDGNQVTKVTDQGYGPLDYGCKRYMDLADETVEMDYDANGNLVYDLDREIVAIRYNILNLPDTVQFKNGNQIVNHYDALGNRYKTTYHTRKVATVVPISTTLPATTNLSEYILLTHAMDKNIKYIAINDAPLRLDYVFNSEGYIRYHTAEEHYPFYYVKDHLGNVRETYVSSSGTSKLCVQRMQYYPSGLPWNDNASDSEQPYKYNGKEFVEMHGLDEYDSQARWYYAALGRTTTMDPLAEKYYGISPYAWCGNNMVNFVDLYGDSIQIAEQDRERMDEILRDVFEDEADNFDYNDNGMLVYNGDESNFSRLQQEIFSGLKEVLEQDKITVLSFGTSITFLENGEPRTIDVSNYAGALTVLVDGTTPHYIIIDPTIQSAGVILEDATYLKIKTNVTDATFHEIGHVLYDKQPQSKVIDYENKVRRILRLPRRPYDIEHNKNTR